MSYLLAPLLSSILKEYYPGYGTSPLDQDMFALLTRDYLNYCSVVWKVRDEVELIEKLEEVLLNEEGPMIREFTLTWFFLWKEKFQKRVRLILDCNDPRWKTPIQEHEAQIVKGMKSLGSLEVNMMIPDAIEALVRRGEIACTKELAEQMILMEAAGNTSFIGGQVKEKCEFFQRVIKRIEIASRLRKPLIFIKVNRDRLTSGV